jgi:hypothetical protein
MINDPSPGQTQRRKRAVPSSSNGSPRSAPKSPAQSKHWSATTKHSSRALKTLLRLLIDELRVNGRAEILPTYRLVTPQACAMSEKVGGTRHCANHPLLAADRLAVQ